MKSFLYNLNKTDVDIFFPKERIKKKIQIIKVLLEFIRTFLLVSNRRPVERNNVEIPCAELIIDKRSRVFFFSENRI